MAIFPSEISITPTIFFYQNPSNIYFLTSLTSNVRNYKVKFPMNPIQRKGGVKYYTFTVAASSSQMFEKCMQWKCKQKEMLNRESTTSFNGTENTGTPCLLLHLD